MKFPYARAVLFGRAAELAGGARLVAGAIDGRGGTLVLSGEPGIGKSVLARELGRIAEAAGARVAFGRAWEVGGAPAYWPWTQALAELELDLDALLGVASGEMASAQRVAAFDRVTRALRELARERPLVILLDDLHAADTASLELALALARGISRHRVALIVTTRESELLQSPPHGELIARLGREGQRIALGRLGEASIAEWLAAEGFAGDATEVLRVTEGTPLFVEEAIRLGVDRFASATAGGVAALLSERLERASEATRRVLAAAAVVGREAAIGDVAVIAGASPDEVAAAAVDGVRAGILAGGDPAEMVFAHVLVRDALYGKLPPSRRAELHARTAALLEARPGGASLAASHLLAAGDEVPVAAAVGGVVRAAESALARHAADEAVALVERARAALAGRLDEPAALAFDLVVADARMRAGAADEARALALSCAEQAVRLGRATDHARAALVYGLELTSGQVDPVMVRLLEEALAAIRDDDAGLRARLLARLASAMVPPRSEAAFEQSQRYAREAIALARAAGDPDALLYALRFTASALGYAVSQEERLQIVEELLALARARGDTMTLVNVGGFHVSSLFETCRPHEAHAEAEAYARLIDELPLPQVKWRSVAMRASIAALEARYQDAHALGGELRRVAAETGARPGLLAWSLFQVSLSLCDRDLDRFTAIEREVVGVLGRLPPLAPWLACVHALRGRRDEALAALQPVIELPRGFPWLVTAGQVVALLEDRALAERFYPLLEAEGFRGRFFWGPAGVFPIGPTSRVLGELALLIGRTEIARAHLDEAVRYCREAGALSLLDASERARARIGAASAPFATPEAPERLTISLVREGDVWLVTSSAASPFRVKHGKGFEYLNTLLVEPGREHHVLDLAGAGDAPEDAGPILDGRAKAAYRRRVEELDDELAEAERLGDAGRAGRARAELDALADQLAGAIGLGGRDRKAASNVERARINVQRRIKDAIRRIGEHAPEIARYLDATIRTGTYCSFEPV